VSDRIGDFLSGFVEEEIRSLALRIKQNHGKRVENPGVGSACGKHRGRVRLSLKPKSGRIMMRKDEEKGRKTTSASNAPSSKEKNFGNVR